MTENRNVALPPPKHLASLLLLLSLVFPIEVTDGQDWQTVGPGMTYVTFRQTVADGPAVTLSVLRIDPGLFTIKVVDVYGLLSKKTAFPTYSLNELVDSLHPAAIINAGFSSSFSVPSAAGLLIIDGKVISRLNPDTTVQNGVFSIGAAGVKIAAKERFDQSSSMFAVQAGPILIDEAVPVAVPKDQDMTRYRRSCVAVDTFGNLLLINTSETTLTNLAQIFVQSDTGRELNLRSLLNLSGAEESALYLSGTDKSMVTGNPTSSIASAIAVFKR